VPADQAPRTGEAALRIAPGLEVRPRHHERAARRGVALGHVHEAIGILVGEARNRNELSSVKTVAVHADADREARVVAASVNQRSLASRRNGETEYRARGSWRAHGSRQVGSTGITFAV
jgi:hypothetical protein